MPRLNRLVRLLEERQVSFGAFSPPEIEWAQRLSTVAYDALIFETEHKPWDPRNLRHAFQYLLNRGQIHKAESLAPSVTPLVRIPPNGSERSQWHAKQALDLGAFGIVWPHIRTAEEAKNAISACRYPSLDSRNHEGPMGVRGDSPTNAARYWGVSNSDYYRRSGVWSLDQDGEVLVALMIESVTAIENLDEILAVPGVGLVIVGEGDLSQELGVPRQYDHTSMIECKDEILRACKRRGVAVAHPHVTERNVEQVIEDGYSLLLAAPVMTYPGLERGRDVVSKRE